MAMLQAFKYKAKGTFIHELDPRTKLLFTVVFSFIAMIFYEIVPLLIMFTISILLIFSAKCGREWIMSLKGLSSLLVFIIVINYFFRTLNFALAMGFRLLVLSSIFSLFFLTVHPDDLAQSLIQLHAPFDLAFAMSMATRYVPTLAMEAETIMDSQKSRGLELEKGNLIKKIKNFVPILVPLIINSIRRALSIAESLESRCFGITTKRTYYNVLKLKKKDYVIIIMTILIGSYITFLKFSSNLPDWFLFNIPF
ncbi:MAG: energy-coupling factor transporter transmembrane component T family protein [Candidatus Ranarchaeia archaeon]